MVVSYPGFQALLINQTDIYSYIYNIDVEHYLIIPQNLVHH